jgi:xanthine/uracil permease
MFWTWGNLKRVYVALAVIAVVAVCAWFVALQIQAPAWVLSAICVAAFGVWVGVAVAAVVKQGSQNRRD